MTRLAPDREHEIRELEAAATPGPWTKHSEGAGYWSVFAKPAPSPLVTRTAGVEDAAFIAAARQAVPALLAEVDALRAERDALSQALGLALFVKTEHHAIHEMGWGQDCVICAKPRVAEALQRIAALAAFPGVPADKGGNR